jgi:hypothetical protein
MMSEPWEIQQDESSKAFEAFVLYRDAGPDRRLTEVSAKLTVSRQSVGKWSKKYQWPARVAAWDAELDRQRRDAHITTVRETSARHAQIARAMQNKAVQRLQSVDASKLTPSELIRFIEIGIKIERDAMGIESLLDSLMKGDEEPSDDVQKVLGGIDIDRV